MAEPRSSDAEPFTTEYNSFSSSDRHRQAGLIPFQINQFSSAPFRQDDNMHGILQTRMIDSGERVIKIGNDDDDFVVPVYTHSGIEPSYSNSQISTEFETVVPSSPSSNFQAIEFQNYPGKDPKSPYPITILTASSSGHGYLKGHLSDDNYIESISDPFGTMMTDKTREKLNECEYSDQHLHDEPIIQSCRDMSSTKDVECENRFVDYYKSGKESISKPTTCSYFGIKDDSFMMESSVDEESNISKTSMTCSSFGMTISPDDVVRLIGQKNFWKMRMTIANQQRIFVGQLFELHRLIKVQKLFATTPPHLLQSHRITTFGNSLPVKHPSLPSEPDPLNPLRGRMHVFSEGNSCGLQPADHNPSKSLGRGDPPIYQWLLPMMSPSDGLVYKPISGSGLYGGSYAPPSAPSSAAFRIRPCHILPSDHNSAVLPPFYPLPIPVFGSLAGFEEEQYVPDKGRQLGYMVSRGGSSSTGVTYAESGDSSLQQSWTSKKPEDS